MIRLEEIRELHIEFSSSCNSRCPMCPRNVHGYNYNGGYKECDLSLDIIKKQISPMFIEQLDNILINGNLGDFLLNDESLDIIEYFRNSSSKLKIEISTNGSARNADWWKKLAELKAEVFFCIDGLSDTHSLYRQDTHWDKIIENAKIFISHGGIAGWKMIKFDHNEHQIESCRNSAKRYGFNRFILVDTGRNTAPVFDRNGNWSHDIGDEKTLKSWNINDVKKHIASNKNRDFNLMLSNIAKGRFNFDTSVDPVCETKNRKTVYISSEAKVYPCCYLGFSPETFRFGPIGARNDQYVHLIKNNDLNYNTLEEAIQWFNEIEKSWSKKSFLDGRILQCDVSCNKCKKDSDV